MCYPNVKRGQRGFVPARLRADLAPGVFVDGFGGWHVVATLEPLRTLCGMGFGGVLPTHGATSIPGGGPGCSTCRAEAAQLETP